MENWLNNEDVPWVVSEVGKNYVHINHAFYRTFGHTLGILQTASFEDLWGIKPDGVVHRINEAIQRTRRPQLATSRIRVTGFERPLKTEWVAWHTITGGILYRHSICIGEARTRSTQSALQKVFTDLKLA